MRLKKIILPLLALIGLALGLVAVFHAMQTPPTPPIPYPPPTAPYEHSVAGEGIVEASSRDILIGSPVTEIVDAIYVTPGDRVEKGAPLFKLDTSVAMARLKEREASYERAEQEYQKLLDLPRLETVPPERAKVKLAEADYINRMTQFELVDKLENPRAVSRDEYNQRKYEALAAKYRLEEAEEVLSLLLAGSWIRDLEIARAEVKEAKAQLETAQSQLEEYTIKAPLDGMVLRVNTNVGELVPANELNTPLIIFGCVDPLHIRVDIDEEDVWRVKCGAKGIAYMRGNSRINVPLTYVRLDPYLVPKANLTSDTTEKVDTRVLQLIYRFDRDDKPIFPGMLMDVYVEGRPNGAEQ